MLSVSPSHFGASSSFGTNHGSRLSAERCSGDGLPDRQHARPARWMACSTSTSKSRSPFVPPLDLGGHFAILMAMMKHDAISKRRPHLRPIRLLVVATNVQPNCYARFQICRGVPKNTSEGVVSLTPTGLADHHKWQRRPFVSIAGHSYTVVLATTSGFFGGWMSA
jgi:hypothetical protein